MIINYFLFIESYEGIKKRIRFLESSIWLGSCQPSLERKKQKIFNMHFLSAYKICKNNKNKNLKIFFQ